MFDVLDSYASNLQIAVAQFEGEAVSFVVVCSQPVRAPIGENSIYVILGDPYTRRPNNFRLREALTLYEQ